MNEILSFWAQWLRPSAGLPTVQWSLLLKSVDGRDIFIASLVDHERVLDAIIQRDGDLASARMTALVIDSLNITLAFLAPAASAPIHKTA